MTGKDNPRPMLTPIAPLDPRARAVAVPSDDDLAREDAELVDTAIPASPRGEPGATGPESPDRSTDAALTDAERQYGLLLSEHLALKEEIAIRRERAERAWTYPPITDLDRANEEVRRLRAYIAEWASSQWDGDREGRYRDDPVWLKRAWHLCSKMWGEAALEARRWCADVATLKRQIDVLVGFLVAYAPDCATQLKFYVLERDRLMAQVRDLKREIGIQNEANRRHKAERESRAPLWDATLTYGAAHESRLAERDRLHAANYQGDTAEGAAYSALLVAEADALDALHAAYADYAARAGGGGAGEDKPDGH